MSGGGTNLQAIIDSIESGRINAKISAIVSSNKNAFSITRAKKHNIPAYIFDKKDFSSLNDMYLKIEELLKNLSIDLIVLAGFMSIIPKSFISAFKGKIINVHPSLIPSFCGKGYYGELVHQAVIDSGCRVSGATVHFVDEGVDTGAIILQEAVSVYEEDDAEKLAKRVLKVEHKLLPAAIRFFCEDKLLIKGKKVFIKEI